MVRGGQQKIKCGQSSKSLLPSSLPSLGPPPEFQQYGPLYHDWWDQLSLREVHTERGVMHPMGVEIHFIFCL